MQTLNHVAPLVDLESEIKTAEQDQRPSRQRDFEAGIDCPISFPSSSLGTRFAVSFSNGADCPGVLGTKAASGPVRSRHLRMLVVDDNVDSAESLAILLRLDGHEVRTAYAGPSALAVAAEFAPAVVLQDICLPGMSGYELARRLRQHSATAKSLLVAVSGHGQEDDLRRSRAAGFDHYVVKPIDFDELVRLFAAVGEAVS